MITLENMFSPLAKKLIKYELILVAISFLFQGILVVTKHSNALPQKVYYILTEKVINEKSSLGPYIFHCNYEGREFKKSVTKHSFDLCERGSKIFFIEKPPLIGWDLFFVVITFILLLIFLVFLFFYLD